MKTIRTFAVLMLIHIAGSAQLSLSWSSVSKWKSDTVNSIISLGGDTLDIIIDTNKQPSDYTYRLNNKTSALVKHVEPASYQYQLFSTAVFKGSYYLGMERATASLFFYNGSWGDIATTSNVSCYTPTSTRLFYANTNWTALYYTTGSTSQTNVPMPALLKYPSISTIIADGDTTLYVGGNFMTSTSVVYGVIKVTNAATTPVIDTLARFNSTCKALQKYNDTLYAVFSGMGLYAYNNSNKSWMLKKAGTFNSLCTCNSTLFVGGDSLYEYDGTFTQVQLTGAVNSMATCGDTLYVGGAFSSIGSTAIKNLAKCATSSIPTAVNNLVSPQRDKVYPNPSASEFNIAGNGMASLYDMAGHLIKTFRVTGKASFSVPAPGMYIVKLNNEYFRIVRQ